MILVAQALTLPFGQLYEGYEPKGSRVRTWSSASRVLFRVRSVISSPSCYFNGLVVPLDP